MGSLAVFTAVLGAKPQKAPVRMSLTAFWFESISLR